MNFNGTSEKLYAQKTDQKPDNGTSEKLYAQKTDQKPEKDKLESLKLKI